MAKNVLTNEVKKQILLKELKNQHFVDYFIDKFGGLENIISMPRDCEGRNVIVKIGEKKRVILLNYVSMTYSFYEI